MLQYGHGNWQCEAGFHQQLENDLMYFQHLMAMDLQGDLIFGRDIVGDIVVRLIIGVK